MLIEVFTLNLHRLLSFAEHGTKTEPPRIESRDPKQEQYWQQY